MSPKPKVMRLVKCPLANAVNLSHDTESLFDDRGRLIYAGYPRLNAMLSENPLFGGAMGRLGYVIRNGKRLKASEEAQVRKFLKL